jgi:pyridoxine kinase
MNILSLQSWVCYGHVGNAAAVFPLQRLGAEVWAVNTVQLSNHPGYGGCTGDVFSGAQIAALVDGIAARGALARCDAALSGYLGSPETAEAVQAAATAVKRANPRALYCCDPVIGDEGPGVYVRPGIDALLREQLLPLADIATPNRFELGHLTAMPVETLAEVKAAAAQLQRIGPRIVAVTSLRVEDTPADCIDMLIGEAGQFWRVRTPRLAMTPNGAGDLTAALLLFHIANKREPADALGRAASSLFGILRATLSAGERELQIVQAQEELINSSHAIVAQCC